LTSNLNHQRLKTQKANKSAFFRQFSFFIR
jgi:hypothetical protein